MRVVLDTNVIISRYLSPHGPPAQILERWEVHAFELLVSQPILDEYRRALLYERVAARHGLSVEEVDEVVEAMGQFGALVAPEEVAPVVALDPEDDKFLACAVVGGADYIVSGDAHLLALEEYRGIVILSPRAFLTALEDAG